MIDKSIREIERERQGLQTQEKKLIVEIKKIAKQGQMVSLFLSLLAHKFAILSFVFSVYSSLISGPTSLIRLKLAARIIYFTYISQGAVKVMAKDLIRTRHQIEKFYKLKSQTAGCITSNSGTVIGKTNYIL